MLEGASRGLRGALGDRLQGRSRVWDLLRIHVSATADSCVRLHRKIRSSPPAGAAPSPHARPVRTRLPCGEERGEESMGRGGCQGIFS